MSEARSEAFVAVTVPLRSSSVGIPEVVMEAGYQLGLRLTGCHALTVSTALREEQVDHIFRVADGLLLTGGEDLAPSRYGQETRWARDVSTERDALEVELARRALESGMPTLAICRGMQLLNVILGGSLYQDLAKERDDEIPHDRYEMWNRPIHELKSEGARWLKGILPEEPFPINSAHHQGIRRLGRDLRPVAWARDGLVEAVEYDADDAAWTVGVQWHPERLLDDEPGVNAALFRRFGREVQQVARRRQSREFSWPELSEP